MMSVILKQLADYLLSGPRKDIYRFSASNTQRIIQALKRVLATLEAEHADATKTMEDRRNEIRKNLKIFIPDFEKIIDRINYDNILFMDQSPGSTGFNQFMIGYISLSIWADTDNHKDFGVTVPVQNVNKDGTFYTESTSGTHCNRFVYIVVLNATGKRMTKGESLNQATFYGIMGAGVYFGNERGLSDAAIRYLSNPTDSEGEFGHIISFSAEDNLHPDANNYKGSNHVGIYIGRGLYISASGSGVSPFPGGGKSVSLANVPNHAHYTRVN